MSELVRDARNLAEVHLATALPRRWRHVNGVARQGTRIASAFGVEADVLVAACWLHDIGYAPSLATTGFHPLDGAVFLRDCGWDERLCALVARHSCAIREATLRGLEDELLVFDDESSPLRDALWFCDMTTSPDGDLVAFEGRLSEILARYGAGSIVYNFIHSARNELLAAVERTEARIIHGSADVGLI
ncbi:HD domain-containing protein [Nocardia sp. NPDC059246]|uniref:HD domain-containing protein n=1 Tax=unclassified Nocardia TaxID=2637762 RepID=UPI0036AFE7B1